jgi:hypothetical protein
MSVRTGTVSVSQANPLALSEMNNCQNSPPLYISLVGGLLGLTGLLMITIVSLTWILSRKKLNVEITQAHDNSGFITRKNEDN